MNEQRIAELLNLIETHDCKMSGEDGCECETVFQELSDLNYQIPDFTAYEIELL